ARIWCTSARESAELIHLLLPSAAADLPSKVAAYFQVTCGRPVRTKCSHARSGPLAASRANRPDRTSTPAARSTSAPPAACGFASDTACTTRAMPAPRSASVHGGVRPVCAQGSSVTTAVRPAARSPACRRATTSACGPPGGWVAPTPTTAPEASSTTQPTGGLGLVVPRTCSLRSIAVRMAAASSSGADTAPLPSPTCAGSHRRPQSLPDFGERGGRLGPQRLDGLGGVLRSVDGRTRHEAVDSGLGSLLDGVGVDAPVDLHEEVQVAGVHQVAGFLDLAEHVGDELLPAEVRLDRHHQQGVVVLEHLDVGLQRGVR